MLGCVHFLQTKYQTKNYEAQSNEAVQELDSVLTQLGVSFSCLPVGAGIFLVNKWSQHKYNRHRCRDISRK